MERPDRTEDLAGEQPRPTKSQLGLRTPTRRGPYVNSGIAPGAAIVHKY
ncbi:MAG: hypothetical protein K2F86_00950 [Duncaniella sp.]|nr:hypothetical protein [Duncaniella sp.]